jgi:hypothetical protein
MGMFKMLLLLLIEFPEDQIDVTRANDILEATRQYSAT